MAGFEHVGSMRLGWLGKVAYITGSIIGIVVLRFCWCRLLLMCMRLHAEGSVQMSSAGMLSCMKSGADD